MIKKLFLLSSFLCLGLIAKAEATDVSQYENVVFPVSTTGSAGSMVTVSVEMNNTVSATGFQFDVVLPEGITVATDEDGFYLIELSETRTTSRKTDFFSSVLQSDGSIRVMCSSTTSHTFEGTSGEVCTMKLNIGDGLANGDYPIIFKNIKISDADARAYRVNQVEATLVLNNFIVGDTNAFKQGMDANGKLQEWEMMIEAGYNPIHYGVSTTINNQAIDQIFIGPNIRCVNLNVVDSNDYPVVISGQSMYVSDHCLLYADLVFDFDAVYPDSTLDKRSNG